MKRYRLNRERIYNQSELARFLKVDRKYVNDLIRGKRTLSENSQHFNYLNDQNLLIDITDKLRFEKIKRNHDSLSKKLIDGDLTKNQIKYINDRMILIEIEMMKLIEKLGE